MFNTKFFLNCYNCPKDTNLLQCKFYEILKFENWSRDIRYAKTISKSKIPNLISHQTVIDKN